MTSSKVSKVVGVGVVAILLAAGIYACGKKSSSDTASSSTSGATGNSTGSATTATTSITEVGLPGTLALSVQ